MHVIHKYVNKDLQFSSFNLYDNLCLLFFNNIYSSNVTKDLASDMPFDGKQNQNQNLTNGFGAYFE